MASKKTNVPPLPSFRQQPAPQKLSEEEIKKRQEAENLNRYQQMVSGIFINAVHNSSVHIPVKESGLAPDFLPLIDSSIEAARELMKRLYGVTIKDSEEEE